MHCGNESDKSEVTSQLVKRCRAEKWSLWSFDTGLQTLPDELARHLSSNNNVNICTGTSCTQLEITHDQVKVELVSLFSQCLLRTQLDSVIRKKRDNV